MARPFKPSALLWGSFAALGMAGLVLRLRAPGNRAVPWIAAALLGLVTLRVASLAVDWRRGRLPGTRILLPALILVEGLGLVLTRSSDLAIRVRFGTAVALEALLLVLAFRALRQSRAIQTEWPEDRIATAFEAFIPPRAARLMALELVMLGSAFRFLLGGFRHPAPPGFSLHRETFLRAMLPALPLLIPTDLVLIHALFPRMGLGWRWFLHLSTLYAVVWMVGLYATLKQRPHQVNETQVSLHMSLLGAMRIPRDWVVSVDNPSAFIAALERPCA